MHITWFSWKDTDHPEAGGAERVSDQIRRRLVDNGHTVTLITAQYDEAMADEVVNGVRTLRAGGRYSVYFKARRLYHSLEKQDLIIDEMNTVPFMASLYRGSATPIMLTYQLARTVWFYQMHLPFSLIGYLLEPLYLRFISHLYVTTLTESDSTKQDLIRYGFREKAVEIFRVSLETKGLAKLPKKEANNSIIFLGALRPMKRPIDAIKAFESARDSEPSLTLSIAGSTSGSYAKKVLGYAKHSRHTDAIHILGRVSEAEKKQLLEDAQLILVTSIKEGWGLIVTEANSQGTPAVVYDSDGLRDSVQADKTGKIVPSGDTNAMGQAILDLLKDRQTYEELRAEAFEHSKQFTFDNSYQDFVSAVSKVVRLS